MRALALLALVLTASSAVSAPPPTEDAAAKARAELDARKRRLGELFVLAQSDAPADIQKVADAIAGPGPKHERAALIRALPNTRKVRFTDIVKRSTGDPEIAVQVEAAIKHYQWAGDAGLAKLRELRGLGLALRRAFMVGTDKGLLPEGQPSYDKNALEFFRECLPHANPYVRMDGAVGLVQLGHPQGALKVIEDVLRTETKVTTRMAAVNYLTPIRSVPGARALLQIAANDVDEQVAALAKRALSLK